jgi:hypothetical protein
LILLSFRLLQYSHIFISFPIHDSLYCSSEEWTDTKKTVVLPLDAYERDRGPTRRTRDELRTPPETSSIPLRIKRKTRRMQYSPGAGQNARYKNKRLLNAASKFFKNVFILKKRKGHDKSCDKYTPSNQVGSSEESQGGRYKYYSSNAYL